MASDRTFGLARRVLVNRAAKMRLGPPGFARFCNRIAPVKRVL